MRVDPNRVREFVDEESFYQWLREHRDDEPEVWIRLFKVRSGHASITPVQAIDVCLCWGWIDAVRKGLDEVSFLQRYCPRGKKSVWSQINVANVERLIAAGRMQPSGLAHVEAAKADGRWARAYRVSTSETPADLLAAIEAEPEAAAMYETLSSQNRFALTFRTLAMKTEAGRAQVRAGRGSGRTRAPPATALEVTIAAAWSDVLGVSRVGRDDYFSRPLRANAPPCGNGTADSDCP